MSSAGELSASQPYQPPANGFRTFLILWVTQTISVMGSALTNFCITIWLTLVLYNLPEQKAQLAAALSIIGVVGLVVSFIFGPIAAVWADRHNRKRTMIAVNFISCCLTAARRS
jgi:MFS family permease